MEREEREGNICIRGKTAHGGQIDFVLLKWKFEGESYERPFDSRNEPVENILRFFSSLLSVERLELNYSCEAH